jgi:hypothetical protein
MGELLALADMKARRLLATVLSAGLVAIACDRYPRRPECTTTQVSITGEGRMGWRMNQHVEFVGSASVVVCQSDAAAVAASREVLIDELGRVVGDRHYGMPFVCAPEAWSGRQTPPSPDELAKGRAEFRKYHADMVDRFNHVLPRPIVKDVQCRFGWVSYEHGKPVSGVS